MKNSNAKEASDAVAGIEPRPGRTSLLTMSRAIAVTAAAALLVGIVVGPIIADNHTQAADSTGTQEHLITVSGTGVVSVSPDVADVMLGVSVTRPTAKEARATAAAGMQAVVASIKKNGVAEKDIVTVNVSLNPVYDYNGSTRRLTGYEFGNTVKATVRDLDKLPAVIDDAVAGGATVVYGISFRLDDPATIQTKAREMAMADARSKADILARSGGVSIKGVAAISETTSSPTPYYYAGAMADAAKEASTPIQTGTTDIRIQITVAYLIG